MVKKALLVVTLATMAAPAWAALHIYGNYGFRNLNSSGSTDVKFTGNALRVGLLLDPIPLVPVAFGGSINQVSVTKDDYDLQGQEIAVEAKAWVPGVPFITPYGRLGYVILGEYALDFAGPERVEGDYDASGVVLAVGIDYPVVPLVELTLEYSISSLTLTETGYVVDGAKSDAGEDLDVDTSDIYLGATIGF